MSDQRIPISQLSETQTAPDASYIAIDDGSLTKKITVENFNSTSTASAQQYANQAAASAQTVEDNIATSAAQIREATLAAREATQASTAATASATSAYDSASLAQNYSANASTSAGQAMNAADSAAQNLTASKGYAEDSEAWAVGKRNGSDVPTSDETYQNNAKYYANSASGSATRAETAAQSITAPDTTLTVSGVAAESKATGDRISSVNAELVDIRVMTDGKTASTAGDAVRTQITELKNDLDENVADLKNALTNAFDAENIPSANLFYDGTLNSGKQWNCWTSSVYQQTADQYSCGEFDIPTGVSFISSNFYWANNSFSAYVDENYNKIGLVKNYYQSEQDGYVYSVPSGAKKVCFSFNSTDAIASAKLASAGIVYIVGSEDITNKTVDDYPPTNNFYADNLMLQSEGDKTLPQVIDELQDAVGTNWAIKANLQRGWTNTGYGEQDQDGNYERVIVKLDKSSPLVFTGAATSNQFFYYLLFADENGEYIHSGQRTNTGNTTDTVLASEYPEGAVYAQITYNRGKAVESTITNGNITQIVTSEMLPILRDIKNASGANAEIVIPSTVVAVVGDTLQIYYDSIVKSTSEDIEVEILGTKGKAYPRYFEYTPTDSDVGTTTLIINLKKYNDLSKSKADIIATKTIYLNTVRVPSNPSAEKHVLCIGDSTIVDGTYVKEVAKRISTAEGNGLSNVKFTGRLKKTVSGVEVGYEGFSGWNWNSYISSAVKAIRFYVSGVSSLNFEAVYQDSNGCRYNIAEVNVTEGTGNIRCIYVMGSATTTPPTSGTLTRISGTGDASITYTNAEVEQFSPFVVNGSVDFTNYVNEYCGGSVDYVVFSLGTNSIINVNAEFSTIKNNILSQMNTLIGKLHEQYPNVVVLLCTLQKGSMRGGFGANFGTAYNANADFYNRKVYQLNQTYIEFANSRTSYMKIVDVSGEFDTLYDYPHIMKAVNVRDTTNTEMIDTNFGHPSNIGYMQMADAMYRALCGELVN